MQGCVAVVGMVWVLKVLGVVFYDAPEEDEVVEVDGAADAGGRVDPGGGERDGSGGRGGGGWRITCLRVWRVGEVLDCCCWWACLNGDV